MLLFFMALARCYLRKGFLPRQPVCTRRRLIVLEEKSTSNAVNSWRSLLVNLGFLSHNRSSILSSLWVIFRFLPHLPFHWGENYPFSLLAFTIRIALAMLLSHYFAIFLTLMISMPDSTKILKRSLGLISIAYSTSN